ncbi:MAG: M20/M25/M40 family metallo-hydrolase [Actinomycetota bacterium]
MEINKERLLKTFFELLKIKSPSKDEKEIVGYIKCKLEKIGLEVKIDDAGKHFGSNSGNIIALFKNKNKLDSKPIFLNAHVDTVKLNGNVIPEIIDGKIINKNKDCILGGDDKVAVAAIIEALNVIKDKNISTPDIYVVFTISEEIGIFGAKHIKAEDVKAYTGFTFDADGDIGTIINKAPYQNTIKMVFKGKAAHAGIEPEKGINSIQMASDYISGLEFGRIDFETTTNVGTINGGVAKNIVPEKTEIEMEIRSRDLGKLKDITGNMLERVDKIKDKFGGDIKYNLLREYDGFEISESQWPVKIAKKAISSLGIKPVLKETGGGSDVNIFNSKNKQAINLSAGMEKVHTADEYVKVDQVELLAKLIMQICKYSGT